VPNFSAGGIATPADAALMMQLGAEAVFVGSGIFKSEDPARMASAIVQATTHYFAFHPELTNDTRIHQYFLGRVNARFAAADRRG
jgi:pyridoxal 5'-phosphate synthase pdxS subunit